MTLPGDKFLIVDGRYIHKSTIKEILPSGDVALLDGRIIYAATEGEQ